MRGETPTGSENISRGRIRVLPDELVDQIAAGEVVERPASVVKELVENALDAGATRIRVEIRDGGAALVAVDDNGIGMSPDEARLALQRHATSKIRSAEDLAKIVSFGFRGEALPAIASVSRFRLRTRTRGAREGFEIRIDCGRHEKERSAGGPEGTRIEVADLFANVPARRKFLKKPGTEWGHVADWLGRLALSLPGVHFEIVRDNREASVWPATKNQADRIDAVLTKQQAGTLVPVVWEEGAGHVEAWVSGPEHTRPNANGLYLYVNGRPVRDKLLRHALLDAYRDVLPRGRYPTAVLFLTVAPDTVDVNVHPAKWEVRFVDPQAIHRLVRHAVREAMQGRGYLAGPEVRSPEPGPPRAQTAPASRPGSAGDWTFATRKAESPADRVQDRVQDRGQEAPGGAPLAKTAKTAETAETAAPALLPTRGRRMADSGRLELGSMRLIGQALASYLVVEGDDGLILVDQHAAHERILYERLRASWLERGVERQGLLVPVTVELEPLATAALGVAAESVERLGFDLEPFGESAVMVRAIPALLTGSDPEALVRGLAQELESGEVAPEAGAGETRLVSAADRVFASLACHSARRFGDHLPAEEQRAILKGLDAIPWAPTCPHGRPVAAVMLHRSELERRFGRS